jgi:hypothetical protein
MPSKGGSRKYNGGGGAAEYGVEAYGNMGSQVARGDGTNMIRVNANACMKGGSKCGSKGGSKCGSTGGASGSKGGAFLDTVALPVAFIAANTLYKGRKGSNPFTRSRKFGKKLRKMTRRQRRR